MFTPFFAAECAFCWKTTAISERRSLAIDLLSYGFQEHIVAGPLSDDWTGFGFPFAESLKDLRPWLPPVQGLSHQPPPRTHDGLVDLDWLLLAAESCIPASSDLDHLH